MSKKHIKSHFQSMDLTGNRSENMPQQKSTDISQSKYSTNQISKFSQN